MNTPPRSMRDGENWGCPEGFVAPLLGAFALMIVVSGAEEVSIPAYWTSFDAMDAGLAVAGQEQWGTNDPAVGEFFGGTDGIATIFDSLPEGGFRVTRGGFIGGFFRGEFLPLVPEVKLWRPAQHTGPSLHFSTDFILVPSPAFGAYSPRDSFGWCVTKSTGEDCFRLGFEPTNGNEKAEIVYFDEEGNKTATNLLVPYVNLYTAVIALNPEADGDRLTATVEDEFNTFPIAELLLPSGTIQSVAYFGAYWRIANPVVDPEDQSVTGFGGNYMAFDNYGIEVTPSGEGDAADYATWASTVFANCSGADTAFEGDPDGDGLLNGLEFVHGTDPKTAGGESLRVVRDEGGAIQIAFPWTEAATDVEWKLWRSRDFAAFTEAELDKVVSTESNGLRHVNLQPKLLNEETAIFRLQAVRSSSEN